MYFERPGYLEREQKFSVLSTASTFYDVSHVFTSEFSPFLHFPSRLKVNHCFKAENVTFRGKFFRTSWKYSVSFILNWEFTCGMQTHFWLDFFRFGPDLVRFGQDFGRIWARFDRICSKSLKTPWNMEILYDSGLYDSPSMPSWFWSFPQQIVKIVISTLIWI